jgi:hypothetical protein
MKKKIQNYIISIVLPVMFLLTAPALLNAGELSNQVTESVTTITENLFSLLPESTPAKAEAQAVVDKLISIYSNAGGGAENWIHEQGSRLPVVAQQVKQQAENFEQALQGASTEVQAAMDAIFVSTHGKITYEGTNRGVPGVVVIQMLQVENKPGGPLVGISLTDFQGNYTIIYPGNVLALMDGVPDLKTRVMPVWNVLPATPGSWTLAYNASGALTKTENR